MITPTFVHICVNWRTRDVLLNRYWQFMQHYPGAVLEKHRHNIIIPGIMRHAFTTADLEVFSYQGLELKGFDVEYGSELSLEQIEFLKSRVRG